VKPVDFELFRPATLGEALDLLAEHGEDAKVLAGGQSLIPLLNFRLARPDYVVDIGAISSLRAVRRTSDGVTIGATVTHAQASRSTIVAQDVPLMTAALRHVAHTAIRNRGTVGGSIAHSDPAAELPAVARALDAELVAISVRGTRVIRAEDFFVSNLVTSLEPDELLTEIRLPAVSVNRGAAFLEVGRRRGDFALAGAGADLRFDTDGRVVDARIAVTGVSAVPYRAADAEALLLGRVPDKTLAESVAASVREGVDPAGDLHATAEYRRHVAGTLAGRAMLAAHRAATTLDNERNDQNDLRTA
jgi:CO/xanthine dehydrogenase FAD-binding subunit